MTLPVFHVEAAFGSRARDAAYVWTDVSDRAQAFTYRRGRQHDLDRVEQGQGTVQLKNSDRALEANYASSPYYPNVRPLVPLRAYAVIASTTYYLFQHYVDSWSRKRVGPSWSYLDVSTVDAFEIFSRALLQPAKASLTTGLGSNRDLTYTAINPGSDGNKISVKYALGKSFAIAISSVNGAPQIQVSIPSGGRTANQVLALLNANAQVAAAVSVELAAGSSGAGTITTMAKTLLSGGVSVTFPEQASGARVAAVLDWISWPSWLRVIGTGQETIQARSLAAGDTLTVLAAVQEASGEGAEEGLFFMDGRGRAVFLDRHQMITSPYTVSQATFTDLSSESSYVKYQDAVWGEDKEMIFNEWTGKRQSGYAFTVRDPASEAIYGPRPRQINSIVSTKDEMRRILQWRLANYKDAQDMLSSIKVMPGTTTASWQKCLALEVGDRVTVRNHPPGGGSVDSRDYFVQEIQAQIPGDSARSEFTLQLWPVTANWLIVDHASLGLVDLNRVAA